MAENEQNRAFAETIDGICDACAAEVINGPQVLRLAFRAREVLHPEEKDYLDALTKACGACKTKGKIFPLQVGNKFSCHFRVMD